MNTLRIGFCCQMLVLTLVPAALAGSRLAIPQTEFDFGQVPQNSKVSHIFWLYSVGDEGLRIIKVDPGCGCTRAPLEKNFLPPGDSTRLEIIFETGRYTGRVAKRPAVYVEGTDSVYTVGITSHVVIRPDSTFPVVFHPYKLDLSQYGEIVRDRAKFTITNVSEDDLIIKLVESVDDFGTLSLPDTVKAGGSVEAELLLNASVLSESFEKSITFEVNGSQPSRFTLPVRRKLKDPRVGRVKAP